MARRATKVWAGATPGEALRATSSATSLLVSATAAADLVQTGNAGSLHGGHLRSQAWANLSRRSCALVQLFARCRAFVGWRVLSQSVMLLDCCRASCIPV